MCYYGEYIAKVWPWDDLVAGLSVRPLSNSARFIVFSLSGLLRE